MKAAVVAEAVVTAATNGIGNGLAMMDVGGGGTSGGGGQGHLGEELQHETVSNLPVRGEDVVILGLDTTEQPAEPCKATVDLEVAVSRREGVRLR